MVEKTQSDTKIRFRVSLAAALASWLSVSTDAFASSRYGCVLSELRGGRQTGSAGGEYDLHANTSALELSIAGVTATVNYTSRAHQRGLVGVLRSQSVRGASASFLTYEPVTEIRAGFSLAETETYVLTCKKL